MSSEQGRGNAVVWIACLVGAVVVGALVIAWHGTDYWDYSEGVYALTSRLWLHGHTIYRDTALAQPPGVVVFGSGALTIHDGLQWLRIVVGAWQVIGALALAGVVWELTASRVVTIATPIVALLLPWTVHEFGQLTPETVGAPLLAIGLLLVVRGHSRSVGLVAGLLVCVKLPYLLPALALIMGAARWRPAAIVAAITVAVAAIGSFAFFGTEVWTNIVTAQSEAGLRTIHNIGGYWTQGLWNLIGLLVIAGFGYWVADAELRKRMEPLVLVAVATSLTALSTVKLGTALNVLVAVEVTLAPLVIVGAVNIWRGRSRWRWLLAIPIALVVAQTGSIVISPSTPRIFMRPGSNLAWAQKLTSGDVDHAVFVASHCPPTAAYPGDPFIAFVGHRVMPGDQPDQFLLRTSPSLEKFRKQARAVGFFCS